MQNPSHPTACPSPDTHSTKPSLAAPSVSGQGVCSLEHFEAWLLDRYQAINEQSSSLLALMVPGNPDFIKVCEQFQRTHQQASAVQGAIFQLNAFKRGEE